MAAKVVVVMIAVLLSMAFAFADGWLNGWVVVDSYGSVVCEGRIYIYQGLRRIECQDEPWR